MTHIACMLACPTINFHGKIYFHCFLYRETADIDMKCKISLRFKFITYIVQCLTLLRFHKKCANWIDFLDFL